MNLHHAGIGRCEHRRNTEHHECSHRGKLPALNPDDEDQEQKDTERGKCSQGARKTDDPHCAAPGVSDQISQRKRNNARAHGGNQSVKEMFAHTNR